jgi:hypothetical protein
MKTMLESGLVFSLGNMTSNHKFSSRRVYAEDVGICQLKGYIYWADWLNMDDLVKPWSKNNLRPVLVTFLVLLSFSVLAIEPDGDAAQTSSSEDETALDELLEEADAEADIDADNEPWVDAHK